MGRTKGIAWYTMLIGLSLIFVAPVVWMALTSFKTTSEATRVPPTVLPHDPTTAGYRELFTGSSQTPVLRWFLNSLLAATGQAVLVLAVASMAAYALARFEFRGKGVLFGAIIATLFVPIFTLIIPNFLIVDRLGWLDTLWALIVPGAAGPFREVFPRQFFLGVPREPEGAGLLEGPHPREILGEGVLSPSQPAPA